MTYFKAWPVAAVSTDPLVDFDEIWVVDFEYRGGDSGNPCDVVCVAAKELRAGRSVKLWLDGQAPAQPPYRIDERALFVYFAGTAECGAHLALGWPLPARVLDLSPEYRNYANGRIHKSQPRGLINALEHFGLPHISKAEKDFWREIVLRGPPYTDEEKAGILDYCFSDDVLGTEALLWRMLPEIKDLQRAIKLRSEFVKISAQMEFNGIPIDTEVFAYLRDQKSWDRIREALVPVLDAPYGVYDGYHFNEDKFEAYLAREQIPWPRLPSGKLELKKKVFRERAKAFQQIADLHELRSTMSDMRSIKLQVGADGRARTTLWPFVSKTSRTQPQAYIFSDATWIRSLIKPKEGTAIAYEDLSAAEFGIAAALSGDPMMIEDYSSGDPYISAAIAFGHAPPGASKKTHRVVRDLFKIVLLACQYTMQAPALAARLGISVLAAKEILRQHRLRYSTYWQWIEAWTHRSYAEGQTSTCFGWDFRLDQRVKESTLMNWPVQAHCAEILRVSCILAAKLGLKLLAPVHDAILIEAPIDRIDHDVALLRECMRRASRIVLNPAGGTFELRTDADPLIVPSKAHPIRYEDKRGEKTWAAVTKQIDKMRAQGV